MNALMIQGTSSSAGKSLIVTALARSFARRGVSVAPFKAQNMSNNARVVRGGEIGVAQYLQALAAGIKPDVRMNPVLVKPEGDTRSQVIVLGRVNAEISALPWVERGPVLWQGVETALRALHEPEGRVHVRHQRGVGGDAEDPAVHPEHEVVEGFWIAPGEEQGDAGEEDEQADEPA